MKLLSRAEEIVLLVVLKLQGNAYGVTIREQINKDTDSHWSFGSIYMPLNKLSRKGFVQKRISDPVNERGGRSKCLYEITDDGKSALLSIRKIQESVWDGVSDLLLKKY